VYHFTTLIACSWNSAQEFTS